ncbi:MAG: tetratricopeptide repeat protein [Gemmataceae bacterium]
MPTINTRFLLVLLAVFAVSAGVIFGVHTIQERRIPASLRGHIDRATAEGKRDVAIRYLRQYLEFRPRDLDAKVELAENLNARGSKGELTYLYDAILRVDPKRVDVRRDAVALALQSGRYTDALDHAEKVIEANPEDGLAWIQKADALAALHRNEDATKAYETACRFAKDDPRAFRDYLFWLWTEGTKPADAYAVAERFINAFPKLPEPLVSRARMRMAENELPNPEIKADLDRALSLDPLCADASVYLADWLQRAGETSRAREQLVEGTLRHPTDVRFFRRLAWLDLHRNNPITAVAALESGLKTVTKGYDELLVPLGDLLVQLGETKRANQIVSTLQSKPGRTAQIQAKYLQARLAMKAQEWPKAIETLTDLRTDTVSLPGLVTQTNLLLAICHRQSGNPAAERECLMLVLNRDPKHVSARVALGQSYLSDGDIGNAIREYEEAAASPYSTGQTSAMVIKLKALRLRMHGVARPQDWSELDRLANATAAKFRCRVSRARDSSCGTA